MAGGTKVADVYIDVTADLKKFTEQLKAGGKAGGAGLAAEIRRAVSDPANYRGTSPTGNLIASLIGRPGGFAAALRNAIGQGGFKGVGSEIGRALQSSVGGAFTSIEHAASHVFGHIRTLAGEVFKGLALGAGIGGFFAIESIIEKLVSAIPELITKGREFAETVHTITIETGGTAESASQLLGIYQFLGGTAADLNAKVNRLSTTIETNEKSFNALGIVTRDNNGNLLKQLPLLESIRKGMQDAGNGGAATALILKSFGRNGATALGPLLHYLGLTDDQIKVLTADLQKQGLILSESQIAAADAASKAQARIGNAITGLGVTLFSTIGPKLTSFFDGLADFITANAQKISDAISGVVAQIIGLVQGLLGIDLGSFSAKFFDAAQGGSDWARTLQDDTAALDDVNKKLNPVTTAVEQQNAAIDSQIKALEAQGKADERAAAAKVKALDREDKAIDLQVTKLNHLADVQDMLFRRAIAGLTRQYDAELTLLDAEDQRIARAEQAEQDTRASASADRDAARAKRDLAKAQVDLAEANAQYQYDLANPEGDPAAQAAQIKQDILSIADAQQGVRDAQQGIADANQGIADATQATADHARANAEEDRRAEIQKIKDYVATIESIVEDSENKKAALQTLKNREKVLRDEIAAAKAAGHTEEASGLETKLAAVTKGETELTAKIKTQSDIDVLNARKQAIADEKTAIQSILETRKQELADEVAALQDSRQSATEANRAALQKQHDDLVRKIAQDKIELDNAAKDRARIAKEDETILLHSVDNLDTKLDPAFERARVAGIKMADEIRGAIGTLMDILLGGADSKGNRSGGLVGALGAVVDGIAGIAGIVSGLNAALDTATGSDARAKILLVVAGWAALSGNFPVALALLVAAGAITGYDAIDKFVTTHPDYGAGNPVGTGNAGAADAIPKNASEGTKALLVINAIDQLIRAGADPKSVYVDPDGVKTGETITQAKARLTAERSSGHFTRGGYEQGGYVSGPKGMPQQAIVHGGEFVVSNAMQAAGRMPGFVGASGEGSFVIENHTHVHLPWDNQATDYVSRALAYRRRS